MLFKDVVIVIDVDPAGIKPVFVGPLVEGVEVDVLVIAEVLSAGLEHGRVGVDEAHELGATVGAEVLVDYITYFRADAITHNQNAAAEASKRVVASELRKYFMEGPGAAVAADEGGEFDQERISGWWWKRSSSSAREWSGFRGGEAGTQGGTLRRR